MKTLYCCEYCAKQFTDYDEANACEQTHITNVDTLSPAMMDYVSETEDALLRTIHKPGQAMPYRIALRGRHIDDEPVIAVYKLDRALTPSENDEFFRDFEAWEEKRQEENRRYWQEYCARREAEKAAKEAAENAAE